MAGQIHETVVLYCLFVAGSQPSSARPKISILPLVRSYLRSSPLEHLRGPLGAFLNLKNPSAKQKTSRTLEVALAKGAMEHVDYQWRQSIAKLLDASLAYRLSQPERATFLEAMPHIQSVLQEGCGLLLSGSASLSSEVLRAATADSILALADLQSLPYQETVYAAVFRARACASDWRDFSEDSELPVLQAQLRQVIALTSSGIPKGQERFARQSLDIFCDWISSEIVGYEQPLYAREVMRTLQRVRPDNYGIAVLTWLAEGGARSGYSAEKPSAHIDFECFFFGLKTLKKSQGSNFIKHFF